jgi:hypothetical protein
MEALALRFGATPAWGFPAKVSQTMANKALNKCVVYSNESTVLNETPYAEQTGETKCNNPHLTLHGGFEGLIAFLLGAGASNYSYR